MMKQIKIFTLCTILTLAAFLGTACGSNGNDNGTQAPYENEANPGTTTNDNKNNAGSDLKDAGRNLMDSIEDTGDAIRNGVEDIADPNNDMDVEPNTNPNAGGGTTNNGANGTIAP